MFRRKLMKKFDFSSQKTESITHRILFGIVAITFIVFFLFYIVGYDMPYIFEPEYNAPLLTDVLLIFLYFILALALAILVVSIVRGYKKRDRQAFENGIPVVRICFGTVILVILCLAVTFCLGSSVPLKVNGHIFSDRLWLRLTDMFINTMLLLIAVSVICVALSFRRRK